MSNTLSEQEWEDRKTNIAELLEFGLTQKEISEQLEISNSRVSQIIKELTIKKDGSFEVNYPVIISKMCKQLDIIEKFAMKNFLISDQSEIKRTVQSIFGELSKKQQKALMEGKLSKQQMKQIGIDNDKNFEKLYDRKVSETGRQKDYNWLFVILKCIERKAKILHIEAPETVNFLLQQNTVNLTFDQKIQKIHEERGHVPQDNIYKEIEQKYLEENPNQ